MKKITSSQFQYISGASALFLLFAFGIRYIGHQASLDMPKKQPIHISTLSPTKKPIAVSSGSATLAYLNYGLIPTLSAGASANQDMNISSPTPTPSSYSTESQSPTVTPTPQESTSPEPTPSVQPNEEHTPEHSASDNNTPDNSGTSEEHDNSGQGVVSGLVSTLLPDSNLNILR